MHPVTLSGKDFFNGSNNITVSGDYATPSSNRLHENLIQFTEKTRNEKGTVYRHIGAPKRVITGYCFLIFFQHYSSLRTFYYALEPIFLSYDIDLYLLNVHDLKCNVNIHGHLDR